MLRASVDTGDVRLLLVSDKNGLITFDLTRDSVIKSNTLYLLSITFTNPSTAQTPAHLEIKTFGSFEIPYTPLLAREFDAYGVEGGSVPGLVIVPVFLSASIFQTVPLAGARNRLNIHFTTNAAFSLGTLTVCVRLGCGSWECACVWV